MDLTFTLCATAAAIAVAAFCGWRGARPPDFSRGPRLVPWRFLMMMGIMVVILMVVHLANLAGMKTGNGRPG